MRRGRTANPTSEGGAQPPLTNPKRGRRTWLVLVLAVCVIVAATGIAAFYLASFQTAPVPLTISDGSTTGIIEGDFANTTNSYEPITRFFNATTFANETGHTTSTPAGVLSLALTTFVFADYEQLVVDLHFTVRGTFASDLRLRDPQLGINMTSGAADTPILFPWSTSGTNVSYNVTRSSIALDPPMSLPLTGQPGTGPTYAFEFSAFATFDLYSYTSPRFFGFRATVDGQIAPAVGVGVLVETINAP